MPTLRPTPVSDRGDERTNGAGRHRNRQRKGDHADVAIKAGGKQCHKRVDHTD